MESSDKDQGKKNIPQVQTFTVPFALGEKQENLTINTKNTFKPSKEEVIRQAFEFHAQGNISEAKKYYQYFINQGFKHHRVFSNYGVILKNLGNLRNAKIFFQKAIELKPDYADAHLNLGALYRDLGKLKEAEISTRKVIELEPDYVKAHINLGDILIQLKKRKEAETHTLKAIELKSDDAYAYLNLGTIYREIGQLKEAELSTRKAIDLQYDFADAHINQADILLNLGKLNELIVLSKSTLELRSSNEGHKLCAILRITIANLLQKNFSETLLNINKSKELISKRAINSIKDKSNRKHTSTFFRFISSLYPLLNKGNNNPNLEKIPHIGESHCLSFAHQTLSIASQVKVIQPVLVTGAKAWHFANNENNQWKDSFTQQIKNHTYSDKVFISFGEIDCRKDEGILPYSIKKDIDISEVCEKTINGYLNFMEINLSPHYSKKYYFGVPAPTRKKQLQDEFDLMRKELIKIYNSILKKAVLSRGSYFLDVYELTSTKDGVNDNFHMCDSTHLSPECLFILFENHLYKP
jgi:tetratricopeptide (TPR) repeat protein